MTTILTGVEAQPHFPQEDLSDVNAEILELMLSNRELARLGHVEGERIIEAFRQIHPAVLASAKRVYDERPRVEAVDHGVASFETMSMLLASRLHLDITVVIHNSAALTFGVNESNLRDYVHSAFDSFRSDMPRAAEVVDKSSRRFYGSLTEYAMLGAAVTWQMQLDATD